MPDDGFIQYASFPGVAQVVRASYSLEHGILPSKAYLEFAPQIGFTGEGGPLMFFFGALSLTFNDMKVDFHSLQRTDAGLIWSFSLLDRRWKWQYGTISGTYNNRLPDGSLDPGGAKLPQQLASLLLDAMGEAGYDVSGLPNDSYPLVEWDHDNPSQMLADLAESLGCRVVLTLSNTVMVARTGVGLPMPDGPKINDSLTINPPEKPDSVMVVGGKTRYQVDFVLEAVGEELDGTILPIDELSYTPANGWQYECAPFFYGVDDTPNSLGKKPREYAKNAVFRWYRIKDENPDGSSPLVIPGYGEVSQLVQILPIEDQQCETYVDSEGNKQTLPAWVYGVYNKGDWGFDNTDPGTFYTKAFSLNHEKGIVEFADYVWQYDTDGTRLPAALGLRTACSVRDPDTWAWSRYERTQAILGASWNTGPKVYHHDELVLTVVPSYNSTTLELTGETSNEEQLNIEADYYLQASLLEYDTPMPQEVVFAGLMPVSPDGAIQQVSWSVGPSGATTHVGRNNEFSPHVPPYRERRLYEQLKGDEIRTMKRWAKQASMATPVLAKAGVRAYAGGQN